MLLQLFCISSSGHLSVGPTRLSHSRNLGIPVSLCCSHIPHVCSNNPQTHRFFLLVSFVLVPSTVLPALQPYQVFCGVVSAVLTVCCPLLLSRTSSWVSFLLQPAWQVLVLQAPLKVFLTSWNVTPFPKSNAACCFMSYSWSLF